MTYLEKISLITHIPDDFDQVVCCAAGVADTLHSRKQIWRRVTQQHTHLVGLTSGNGRRTKSEKLRFLITTSAPLRVN